MVDVLHSLAAVAKERAMDHRATVSDEKRYFGNIVHDGMFEHGIEFDFIILENILSDDEDNEEVEADDSKSFLHL